MFDRALKRRAEDGDQSIFYVWDGGNSDISESRFKDYVNQIDNYNRMIFLLTNCHSGGFCNNLDGDDRIVITTCSWDESSWAQHTGYSLFGREFLRALNPASDSAYHFDDEDYEQIMLGEATYDSGEDWPDDDYPDPPGDPNLNADSTSSGYVSIEEAFNFAETYDKAHILGCRKDPGAPLTFEHPQYDDDGGLGDVTYF